MRRATTLIVLSPAATSKTARASSSSSRPSQTSLHNQSYDYRFLLVKRSSKNRFFPSSHVFPGGVTEKADYSSLWKDISSFKKSKPSTYDACDHRITGIRELFEETGLLYALTCKSAIPREALAEARKKVHENADYFVDFCKENGIVPDVDGLVAWARWITPEQERYRYDTNFYLAPLRTPVQSARDSLASSSSSSSSLTDSSHHSSHQDASIDAIEVTELDWYTPREALDSFESGEIYLPPPTWYNIVLLSHFPTVDQLVAYSRANFHDFENAILPRMLMNEDPSTKEKSPWTDICMPGDKDHPSSSAPSSSLRRIRVVPGNAKGYEFVSTSPLLPTPIKAETQQKPARSAL